VPPKADRWLSNPTQETASENNENRLKEETNKTRNFVLTHCAKKGSTAERKCQNKKDFKRRGLKQQ